MMSLNVAPSAFRNPISRVRSVTETSIIFITPIPATIKAIPAIPPIKTFITKPTLLAVANSSVAVQ